MDYIRKFSEENGYTPSVREIGKECGIKSTATVHSYIEKLQDRGYLNKTDNKKRSVSIGRSSAVTIPLIGTVTAGQPVFAYENYEYLSDIITQLHNTGFLCSLDDFGTGYSSYNTLKTLDMDEIKLDKFFLVEGVSKERDQLLLKSVIDLVHELHIKVTQEGVETREDFDRLSAMGCDVIQGYYFSKPMKYVTYCEFVKENFEK